MKLNKVIQDIDVWHTWVDAYKKYVPKFIEEAKNKTRWQDWDKDVFNEFFLKSNDQCVSSLKQGYFTNVEKDKIKANWAELAPLLKKIAESQTVPLYDVYKQIEEILRKYTTQHRRSATYRLIAGLQPNLLSTIVNQRNLGELFAYLKKNVDEPIADYTGNWYEDSYNVAQYFKQHVKAANTLDLIAYPWQTMVYFKDGNNINSNEMSETDDGGNHPLNQILYGPPGTGKTYYTKELAVNIIEPNFINQLDPELNETDRRKMITRKYDDLFKLGQIVFTTFHQSMSYEDFVEGIKPKTINNQVQYEVEEGIFKLICQKASVKNGNFDEVIERLKHAVSELDGKPALTIKYGNANSFDLVYKGTSVFYVQPKNSAKDDAWYPVNINNMRIAFNTNEYGALYNPTYIRETLNYLVKNYGLIKGKEDSNKNYVLIIDEINRANVSAVFGELITLLEADKRIGGDEEILVDLTYSPNNEKFGVPSNLYIIGTMNTADRSVEALDTALRRRFSFTEIMPNPEVLEEKKVGEIALDVLLRTINNRIEVLLDRDHTIGHSYFLKIENDLDLKIAFKNNIVPLLQEYFYGDYEKIGLVLGSGFVKIVDKNEVVFPDFIKSNNYKSTRYELVPINHDFDIMDAIDKLWK